VTGNGLLGQGSTWEAPAPGAFTRSFRFGEWIAEPVTPLFESWLVTGMEEGLHDALRRWIGQRAPRPRHVVVNGWYFYSINWLSAGSLGRSLPGIVRNLVRNPRRVAGVIPPTVRFSVPLFEEEWRVDVLPRYRAAVDRAEAEVETLDARALVPLVDHLAWLAGEYFASIAALAGAGYKLEMNLAAFYRRHLASQPGGSHLPLLAGFEVLAQLPTHAVTTLDWFEVPVSAPETSQAAARRVARHGQQVAARQAAEAEAARALAASPRRLAAFQRLLADAQHLVPLREAQVRELTLAWPVMRRAVLRIGQALVGAGALSAPDDVFFLRRDEVLLGLAAGRVPMPPELAARRELRAQQAHLVPPLVVGRINPMLRRVWDSFPRLVGAVRSDTAVVSGSPASAGRATGVVRVIRGPAEFDDLEAGEVLVAPVTAPAWTPLFGLASAVVTDVGSAAAHASIVAREYGIPAVVGCGDATARLRTGMRVTVDGGTGNVELA
jgi:phosphohistidine swiveling domain-containing protein